MKLISGPLYVAHYVFDQLSLLTEQAAVWWDRAGV